jgi:hypothetical protein
MPRSVQAIEVTQLVEPAADAEEAEDEVVAIAGLLASADVGADTVSVSLPVLPRLPSEQHVAEPLEHDALSSSAADGSAAAPPLPLPPPLPLRTTEVPGVVKGRPKACLGPIGMGCLICALLAFGIAMTQVSCVDTCGEHGSCGGFVCRCSTGYSGEHCDIIVLPNGTAIG